MSGVEVDVGAALKTDDLTEEFQDALFSLDRVDFDLSGLPWKQKWIYVADSHCWAVASRGKIGENDKYCVAEIVPDMPREEMIKKLAEMVCPIFKTYRPIAFLTPCVGLQLASIDTSPPGYLVATYPVFTREDWLAIDEMKKGEA